MPSSTNAAKALPRVVLPSRDISVHQGRDCRLGETVVLFSGSTADADTADAGSVDEDRQFAEVVEETRQELPCRAAQGSRLRHQQDQPALQGAPGLISAASLASTLGLQVNAGHGLTTANVRDLFAVPHLVELNIGHHLISRALVIGLRASVQEMALSGAPGSGALRSQ